MRSARSGAPPSTCISRALPRSAAANHARWSPAWRRQPALLDLQAEQERLMRRIGLDPEPRKYTPHVTLARLARVVQPRCRGLPVGAGHFRTAPFKVSQFVLFSSRASTGGGPYVVEASYPLTAYAAPSIFDWASKIRGADAMGSRSSLRASATAASIVAGDLADHAAEIEGQPGLELAGQLLHAPDCRPGNPCAGA